MAPATALVARLENREADYRVQPHNIEAEQALLGAILVNNDAFYRVSDFLLPDHFFEPIHQRVFELSSSMVRAGKLATPITLKTFVNDLEREIINSGRVDFVASRDERADIRAERKDQDLNASEETRKPMGQELGADFMLKGDISTILDTEGKQQVRYYQVDLTLISLADNRKVWVGQKKIKKLVTKPGLRL